MLYTGSPSGPVFNMELSATSELVVIDFLARVSAYLLPIIPVWDLTLQNLMGDGAWWIAVVMDWRTSPWMWWRWRFGRESCFLIWCIEVRLSVAIWE